MQTAAMTIRFLTGCSSKAESADSETVVSHGGLIQQLVVSHLAQTVHSREVLLKLTNVLIHFAEHACTWRDLDALQEASQVLINLPIEGARQIGSYYYALAINRKGQTNEAETLLEVVADNAPITYRARAIQTLGANQHDKGQLDEALRFQLEALRVASDKHADRLLTTLIAHHEISVIESLNGDHKSAFSRLESLGPLVNLVAKQQPFYFYAYCNELAIGLGELGRIAEAKAALDLPLASPYAPAYPNWAETRQELETKRTSATPSVVAIPRATEADASEQIQTAPKSVPVRSFAVSSVAHRHTRKDFQRSTIPIAPSRAIANIGITRSILDRVLSRIGARAPPVLF